MFKRAFYSTMALLLAAPAPAKVDAVDGYVRLRAPWLAEHGGVHGAQERWGQTGETGGGSVP